VILVTLGLFTLAWEGVVSPWSPEMDAWSGVPVQPRFVEGRSALEHMGSTILQAKQCRNCHALEGKGGKRGPDLAGVATRLTEEQLVRQVLQGGGNMPAYGDHLSPHEVTALVAFLTTLHPANQASARSAAFPPISSRGPAPRP
jgi:ubiquinol-cytochrome c reductase cytochrome b subunit